MEGKSWIVSGIKDHFRQLGYSDEDIIINSTKYNANMIIYARGKMICYVKVAGFHTIKRIMEGRSEKIFLDTKAPFIVLAD
jgi:hypothetical protein